MSDLETTQAKLRMTPTAGLAGEHSAYYRRLLSAGYKGYIQGSIGGATLYGAMGLAVGAAVGVTAAIFTGGLLPLVLIPAMGGLGIVHGAGTFADIGKTAAIIAESADTNEKRRYLLDRYYDPATGEEEAKVIKNQLEHLLKPEPPEKMFHMKTVLIGAALGLAISLGFILLPHIAVALGATGLASGAGAAGVGGVFGESIFGFNLGALFGGFTPLAIGAIGTALGTAAGAMIGLDREYVRRWLDTAETAVNDPGRAEKQLATREREINALGDAARNDPHTNHRRMAEVTPTETASAPMASLEQTARVEPISPRAIAGLSDVPAAQVTQVQSQDRLSAIQKAMQVPVL